jgi:XTP/dITP diphosphohydrolase
LPRPALLVATRSDHKLREIRQIFPPELGFRFLDLDDASIPESPVEDELELFDTFEANALAKARYFTARARLPVLADDSGLCVDSLGGAPGVRTKRFSGRSDLSGLDLDRANNQHLLDRLAHIRDPERRTAHYVCVIAVVTPAGDEYVHRGTVEGIILPAPRGLGGFGYDPLFFLPELDATFAEVPPAVKNRLSHRARALHASLPTLQHLATSARGT